MLAKCSHDVSNAAKTRDPDAFAMHLPCKQLAPPRPLPWSSIRCWESCTRAHVHLNRDITPSFTARLCEPQLEKGSLCICLVRLD